MNQTLHGATINGRGGALHESVARTKMKNFILDTSAVEGRPWAYERIFSSITSATETESLRTSIPARNTREGNQ